MVDFPKTYMAYWYSNSKNFGYNYIKQHIKNIEQSFKKQKDSFVALEKSVRSNTLSSSNGKGADVLLNAFLDAQSGVSLEQILCIDVPNGNEIMQQEAQKIFDKFLGNNNGIWQNVKNAYAELKSFKNNVNKDIKEYCAKLEDLVKTTITASGGDISVLEEYKKVLMAHIVENMKTSETVQEAADKALNNLGIKSKGGSHDACALAVNSFLTRDRMPDKFYEIDFGDNAELKKLDGLLSDSLKRTLLLAMALPELDFSNMIGVDGTFTVMHGNKTSNTLSGENIGFDILEELMKKNETAFISIVSATAYETIVTSMFNEMAALFASFPNEQEVAKEFKRTGNNKYRIGVLGIDIDADFKVDPLMEEFFKMSGQTAKQMTRGSNKADSSVHEYGFSIKTLTSKDLEIDAKTQSQGIKILSGSPLSTLIAREAGLGSSGIYHTLQLATGHGVDEEGGWGGYTGMTENEINVAWEEWKDALLSLAFINALTGNEGKNGKIAYQMIYNNRIYHMTDIIDLYAQNNLDGDGSFGSLTVDDGGTGLERDSYLNYWNNQPGFEKPRRKGMGKAIDRSNKYVKEGSKILYATKIKILINAALLPKL